MTGAAPRALESWRTGRCSRGGRWTHRLGALAEAFAFIQGWLCFAWWFRVSLGYESSRLTMKHTVPHDLGLEKAKQVAEAAIGAYKKKFPEYSPESRWASDTKADISFKVKGMSLKGGLEVSQSAIAMELDVPFLLKPFQGKALEVIEKEIRKWIGKAKDGKL